MARSQVEGGKLRGCPTCGTKVSDTDMGLRDYRWVNEALPGKVGGMDIDFVIDQSKTGRVLALEFKPPGAKLSVGARLTFTTFVRVGFTVWVIWGPLEDGRYDVGAVTEDGQLPFIERMRLPKLRLRIKQWWEAGFEEEV